MSEHKNTYSKIGVRDEPDGPVADVEIGYEKGQQLVGACILYRAEDGVAMVRLLNFLVDPTASQNLPILGDIVRLGLHNLTLIALGQAEPVRIGELKREMVAIPGLSTASDKGGGN